MLKIPDGYTNVAKRMKTTVISTKKISSWKGGTGSVFGIPKMSLIKFLIIFINDYD
jgi:hypothetical protein